MINRTMNGLTLGYADVDYARRPYAGAAIHIGNLVDNGLSREPWVNSIGPVLRGQRVL